MTSDRRLARLAGLAYLATFATSFAGLALKTAYLRDGADPSTAAWGAVLELLLAAACVASALALYPIVSRVSPVAALGFVASRTVEATMIMTGVLALMAVVTVRSTGEAATETALVAVHDWAFLLGPAVMSATNALLLGSMLLRGRLVPRVMPVLGLVGAPLLLASSVGVLLGAWGQTSTVGALAALPIAAWELSLGLWLVVRGVRPAATADVALNPAPEVARL